MQRVLSLVHNKNYSQKHKSNDIMFKSLTFVAINCTA